MNRASTMGRIIVAAVLAGLPALGLADGLDDLAKSMGAGDAEHMALAGVLGKTIDALKDPRSVQVVDAYTKRAGSSVTGCFEYRAKNSFGGYGEAGHAVWHLSISRGKPSLLFNADSAAQWNRLCVGKGFSDQKDLARVLIERTREKF